MPIKQIIAERKKYEQIVAECEEKIDTFSLEDIQAKVDALSEEYKKKLKGKSGIDYSVTKAEYERKVDELEYEEVTKPLNDIKLTRYEAKEYYLIYEARVKYFCRANEDIIKQEIERAKHEEVRASLADLCEYIEEA